MSGRGPQTYKKRQKEQQRKERREEKFAKRLQRKAEVHTGPVIEELDPIDGGIGLPIPLNLESDSPASLDAETGSLTRVTGKTDSPAPVDVKTGELSQS